MERVRLDKPKKNKPGFQPGHRHSVGNKGPQAKLNKRYLTCAYIDELTRVVDRKKGTTNAHLMARTMIRKGIRGDVPAANHVRDTTQGRPAQAIELSGKEGKPIQMITGDMTAEEAAQAYADTINSDD